MPRVVAAPNHTGSWRAVTLEGCDFANDPNLPFLGSFEEFTVEDIASQNGLVKKVPFI